MSSRPTPVIEMIETEMPKDAEPRRLLRRALQTVALLAVLVAIVVFAPGLGEVRKLLQHASPGWIAAAIGLEGLSCCSYVLGFRPVFCPHMSWRTTWEISWSELAMGSIVPASGAAGVALGAWILNRAGMPRAKIARRSVAFLLIKSSVNFAAVAVLGVVMAFGVGPHQPLWRTLLPAVFAVLVIAAVAAIGRSREPAHETRWGKARHALHGGVRDSGALLRSRNPAIILGSVGYWIFDNLVLWATYHAVGAHLPMTVILMGYLIGQLGGALPIPGGIGGIDLGLVGCLVVYGAPASATVAAVVAYRVILFWLPLIVGAVSFWFLRRALNDPNRPDLCYPAVGA
jgi:uncharacterized membrane protein YbhN (UPF0104 family)